MKKAIKKVFKFVFIIGIIFMAVIVATLPPITDDIYKPITKTVVLSSDGVQLGEITDKDSTYISGDEIPDILKKAVVSVEDKRFYKHFGVDPIGIGRALYRNIRAGEIVEGGSTITQQVAKNLFFSTKQSYIRKLREAITAIIMEFKMEKDEILTIYLNEIYLGDGAFGVYEASLAYFDKEPADLTIAECAVIAGIIQAPSAYCPVDDEGYVYAMERKEKVLGLMLEQGYISNDEYDEAMGQVIEITPDEETTFAYGVCIDGFESYLNRLYEQSLDTITHHYVNNLNYSEKQAETEAVNLLMNEGLTIHATLNYEMQMNALNAVDDVLEGKDPDADCALVAVDINNGNILTYFGSDSDDYDMAKAPRQPGSTIKPLFMAYLLEKGIADRNTIVNDERFDINGYSPANHAGEYYGYVTMRETLTNSLNAASLRFFLMADTNDIVDYVKTLGISTITEDDYNAAFALGGMVNGIIPRELSLAYAAIANGGTLYEESYIHSIVSQSGVIIYPKNGESKKVMSTNTASQLRSCLESVVLRGSGDVANPGYATMGKTGTTDDAKDVWFAGSTANVAMAVWVGDLEYNEVDNLGSSWCSKIYRMTIENSIDDGCIESKYLSAPREENIEEITILKDEAVTGGISSDEFNNDNLITITVPTYEMEHFEDRQIVKVQIDKITGKLFVEGKCNEMFMEEKYFMKKDAPTESCNMIHMTDIKDTVSDFKDTVEGWLGIN